ncbi:hypothetical protein BgiBS90_015066 [Biomphalaria glabrata]|nr:hypothetical protein BgiBS90_015066 [Biomphalaria glabrata]
MCGLQQRPQDMMSNHSYVWPAQRPQNMIPNHSYVWLTTTITRHDVQPQLCVASTTTTRHDVQPQLCVASTTTTKHDVHSYMWSRQRHEDHTHTINLKVKSPSSGGVDILKQEKKHLTNTGISEVA